MTIYDKVFLEGSQRETKPVTEWPIYQDLKVEKPKRKPRAKKPKED